MLEQITPIVLTFNEEDNIGRTLSRLAWAGRVVIVDSISTDRTLEIVQEFANATVFQRAFDSHGEQWNFGLQKVDTEWAMALDADYYLPDQFIDEVRALTPADNVAGYRAAFTYAIGGKPLHGSLYPPGVVLFRRSRAAFVQDGHTQRVDVRGPVEDLKAKIVHDDRKPVERWLSNQIKYMKLERDAMSARRPGRFSRRLRSIPLLAPVLALFYTLFVKGTILDGWAGIRYASERCAAEWILTLFVLEDKTKG
jgi:glycosyltransferase involved in cell wall biosynthesis